MPQRFYGAFTTTAVPVVTTTETVLATINGVTTGDPSSGVSIFGDIHFTSGTATTAITLRVRRGTGITGTVVGNADALNVAAGNTAEQSFDVVDFPGEVAGQSYVLTIQQTAATGNGSCLQSAMTCLSAP